MNDTRNRRPLTQRDFELRLELLQRIDRMFMSMLIPAAISLASLFFLLGELMTGQHHEHE